MVTLSTHRNQLLGSAAGSVATSIGRAVVALGGKNLGKQLLKRGLTAKFGWGALPLVGVGLAVWGYRAWRRQQQLAPRDVAPRQLPVKDPKPPRDLVDESSWESFPASDPPSFTPRNSTSGVRS